jgi:hypothetical protein
MYQLALSTVPSWQNWSNMWVPQSIDTLCPHCGRMVNLALDKQQHDANRNTVSATARCPACGKNAHFWIIEPGDGRDSSKRGCAELCIYPRPRIVREPIVAGDKISPAVARAYQSALAAYNAGLWTACAASCRRTLEGLVKTLLGEEHSKETLYQQLKSLPEKVNLAEPLIVLAENLRKGGNIASHFELDKEPDQPVAEAMVDLLDYFMEYVYVLKEKAQELEKRLDSLGKK